MKTRSILLSAILIAAAISAFAQSTSGKPTQTAQGTGVIKAVNPAKGTVTIKHQAIASIGWPAMTMPFNADSPSLLHSIRLGEEVHFTLRLVGTNVTVTAITPADH